MIDLVPPRTRINLYCFPLRKWNLKSTRTCNICVHYKCDMKVVESFLGIFTRS